MNSHGAQKKSARNHSKPFKADSDTSAASETFAPTGSIASLAEEGGTYNASV